MVIISNSDINININLKLNININLNNNMKININTSINIDCSNSNKYAGSSYLLSKRHLISFLYCFAQDHLYLTRAFAEFVSVVAIFFDC